MAAGRWQMAGKNLLRRFFEHSTFNILHSVGGWQMADGGEEPSKEVLLTFNFQLFNIQHSSFSWRLADGRWRGRTF